MICESPVAMYLPHNYNTNNRSGGLLMNYNFSNSSTMTSSTIIEDYFPVIIEYDKEELNNKFIEFNYQDTDMLEISVNPKQICQSDYHFHFVIITV